MLDPLQRGDETADASAGDDVGDAVEGGRVEGDEARQVAGVGLGGPSWGGHGHRVVAVEGRGLTRSQGGRPGLRQSRGRGVAVGQHRGDVHLRGVGAERAQRRSEVPTDRVETAGLDTRGCQGEVDPRADTAGARRVEQCLSLLWGQRHHGLQAPAGPASGLHHGAGDAAAGRVAHAGERVGAQVDLL